jgi:hypothetical protein
VSDATTEVIKHPVSSKISAVLCPQLLQAHPCISCCSVLLSLVCADEATGLSGCWLS